MLDIVVGMGDGIQAATIAGRELDRPVVEVAGVAEACKVLSDAEGSALIAAGARLDGAGLEAIVEHATRLGVPLGFINGWGAEDGGCRHAEKIASYPWEAPAGALLYSERGMLQHLQSERADIKILDPAAPDIGHLLAQPRRFFGATAHSNGVDMHIGGSAYLCGLAQSSAASDRRPQLPFLPCGSGGPCMRGRKLGQRPDLISPDQVAADVLVLNVCYGLLPDGALYDPAFSVARSLSDSQFAGAVLTAYKGVPPDEGLVLLAMAMLDEGAPLGEIVLSLNAWCDAERKVFRNAWLLLGDPLVRLPRESAQPPLALESDRSTSMTLEPGATRIILDSPDVTAVTAKRTDGRSLDPAYFLVNRVDGTTSVALLQTGSDPIDIQITAWKQRSPAFAETLTSIWRSTEGLAFTLHTLRNVRGDRRLPEALVERLVSRLERRLHLHLLLQNGGDGHAWSARDRLPLTLDGADEWLLAVAADEIDAWYDLNGEILEFIAAYAQAVAWHVDEPWLGEGLRLIRRVESADDSCVYCGSSLDSGEATLPLLGVARRFSMCHRCGGVSDTSAATRGLWILGPETAVAGTTLEYALAFDPPEPGRWRLHVGALMLPEASGADTLSAPVEESSNGTDEPMWIPITVPEHCHPGVYPLIALLAAHGDIWTARRPILIAPREETS